jgi:phosphoserine aminotransferase
VNDNSVLCEWKPTSSAKNEARALLEIAPQNGGLASMRALIAVSEAEKENLRAWAKENPFLTSRIEASIRFRSQVLAAFDQLAAEARCAG